MTEAIINTLKGIKSDARNASKVVRVIAKYIPQTSNIKSWSSFDTLEGIETKEIHWRFSVFDHMYELYTRSDGKFWLTENSEYVASFWWSTRYGQFVMGRKDNPSKFEEYIIERLMKALRVASDLTPKYHMATEIKYGNYEIFTCCAEILCRNTSSGKMYRIAHTPFGGRVIDHRFPPEIETFINKNFLEL